MTLRPRKGRYGNVAWIYVDRRHPDGPWACRQCQDPARPPFVYYCSKECRRRFQATIPDWSRIRAAVIARDGRRCVLCKASGDVWGEDGLFHDERRLEVGHIKPVRTHPELEFDMSNLRTLCRTCHAKHGARPTAIAKAAVHPDQVKFEVQA